MRSRGWPGIGQIFLCKNNLTVKSETAKLAAKTAMAMIGKASRIAKEKSCQSAKKRPKLPIAAEK